MTWGKIYNREAYIIKSLEKNSVSENTFLKELNISSKTLSNDIKEINNKMKNCSFIDKKGKEFSLFIYNYSLYRKKLDEIIEDDENFNNERFRLEYVIRYLFENNLATLGDLSFEMIISKTTLNKDIEKINKLMKPYDINISGKPNVGIKLVGDELNIRNFIIENVYGRKFEESKQIELIKKVVVNTLSSYNIDKETLDRVKMFLNISIIRIQNGNSISQLPENYSYNLKKFSDKIGFELRENVRKTLNIDLSDNEIIFITIPLRGMRTPLITSEIPNVEIDEYIDSIITDIFKAIKEKMDLEVDLGRLKKEFTYHIYFLLTRIKLDYKIDNNLKEEIKNEYRVAYKMAEIASRVIENRLDKNVNESEKSYLASYFQIYIVEKLDLVNKNIFKIAILTSKNINGWAIKRKLKEADLNEDIYIDVIDSSNVDFDSFDALITDMDLNLSIPIISTKEIYNISLTKNRIHDLIEEKNIGFNKATLKSILLSELDDNKFFLLKDKSLDENLRFMIGELERNKYVDSNFKTRIFEREKVSSTIFSKRVAFPHARSDKLNVALGINENNFPNLIFLVSVPANLDEVLIKLYDEIVTIASNEELCARISKIKSYSELMLFFIKETDLFR